MSACFVYIIETQLDDEDDDYPYHLKIGISFNPEGRMATFQTSSPRKLVLNHKFKFPTREDALWIERKCHALLSKDRRSGEWFETDPTYALIAVVDAVVCLKISGRTGLKFEDIGFPKGMVEWALGQDGDHARSWRAQK